jgi:osmotically-inducible protein OsmY
MIPNLLRGLAARSQSQTSPSIDDQAIREQILKNLEREDWVPTSQINVVVTDGIVHLWGMVHSEKERLALRVVAENTPGVREVEDHLAKMRPGTFTD